MRSPYLVEFRKQLSELNNHLSHYIFVWEQFSVDNADKLNKEKSKLTTQIYPANKFASQYDVKLEKLSESHDETSDFILKSLFILIYTEFEVYMRTLYELARKTDDKLPHLQVKERVPDKIFDHLGIVMTDIFDQKELWTFEYLRLRRNRIVHSGGQSKGELAECIKNKGNALQKYWQTRLSRGLFGVNFQSGNTEKFKKEDIFDFINIWRLLSAKVDLFICQKMTEEKIVNNLHQQFTKERQSQFKRWGHQKAARKFITFGRLQFGINISEDQINKLSFDGAVA